MSDLPRLSVIVCTHNRMDLLPDLLAAFAEQRADPHLFEIVVVGNAVNDGTERLVTERIGATPFQLRYIAEPKLGLSTARNTGIDAALSEIVAFVDDDFLPEPGWADGMLAAFDSEGVRVVGGKTHLKFVGCKEPPWLGSWQRRILGSNDKGESALTRATPSDAFGNNFAFHKSVFSEIGGFSSDLGRIGEGRGAGEEYDFLRRAEAAGHDTFFQPLAFGWHLVPPDRLTPDYLSACVYGTGRDGIFVDAQHRSFNIPDLDRAIDEAMGHGMTESTELGKDYGKWITAHMRRHHCLGRIHALSKALFGAERPSDFSESDRRFADSRELEEALKTVTRHVGREGDEELGELIVRSALSAKFLDCLPDELVSVIVVTHNDGRFLAKSLASILVQSHPNIECIVIDNNSGDDSLEIAETFAAIDDRVRIISLVENTGPSHARNIGIEQARGRYTCFLDGDDVMYQDSLAVRLAAMHHFAFEGVAGSYVVAKTISEFDGRIPEAEKATLAEHCEVKDYLNSNVVNPFTPAAPLIKTELLRAIGGFNVEMQLAEDWELWLRLMRQGYCFVPTGYFGFGYREQKGSLSRAGIKDQFKYCAALMDWISSELPVNQTLDDSPYIFHKPIEYYSKYISFSKRVIVTLGTSNIENKSDAHELMAFVPRDIWDLIFQRINIFNWLQFGERRLRALHGWRLDISSRFIEPQIVEKIGLLLQARMGLADQAEPAALPDRKIRPLSGDMVEISNARKIYTSPLAYRYETGGGELNATSLVSMGGQEVGEDNLIERPNFPHLQPPFGFDVVLASLGRHHYPETDIWTESSPAMPFILRPFAFYDLGGGLVRMTVRIEDQSVIVGDAKFPIDQALQVTTFVGTDGIVQFYFNGIHTKITPRLRRHDLIAANGVAIGGGFLKRYWQGRVSKFTVYQGNTLTLEHMTEIMQGKVGS